MKPLKLATAFLGLLFVFSLALSHDAPARETANTAVYISYDTQSLEELSNVKGTEPLVEALEKSQDDFVRAHAAQLLGECGDPLAVDPLISALDDKSLYVRAYAACSLAEYSDPKIVGRLAETLKDAEPFVRANTAWALGRLKDPRAVEPLIGALSDETPEVRANAAWALGEIGERAAVERLKGALDDEDPFKRASRPVG
jgi:HEAT repeat protein